LFLVPSFLGFLLKREETSHQCRIYGVKFWLELGTNVWLIVGSQVVLYRFHVFNPKSLHSITKHLMWFGHSTMVIFYDPSIMICNWWVHMTFSCPMVLMLLLKDCSNKIMFEMPYTWNITMNLCIRNNTCSHIMGYFLMIIIPTYMYI